MKIKSDVIEILWVITSLDYTINNPDKVLGLIRQFLKPDLYYISENIFISTRKLAFVLHNM